MQWRLGNNEKLSNELAHKSCIWYKQDESIFEYSRQSNNRVNTERVHFKNFRSTRAYLIVTRTRAACAARAKFFQKGTFYLFWIVLIVIMFENNNLYRLGVLRNHLNFKSH